MSGKSGGRAKEGKNTKRQRVENRGQSSTEEKKDIYAKRETQRGGNTIVS